MLLANLQEGVAVFCTIKTGQGIGTTKGKGLGLGQVVPQLLETQGGVLVSLSPQQAYHLAEGNDPLVTAFRRGSRPRDDRAQYLVKADRIRTSSEHEFLQRFRCIQRHISSLAHSRGHIEAARSQAPFQP